MFDWATSVLALTDGLTIRHYPLRITSGVGGVMGREHGAYASSSVTPVLRARMSKSFAACDRGIALPRCSLRGFDDYTGWRPEKKFNCRFGDRNSSYSAILETPLEDLLFACTQQRLSKCHNYRKVGAATCVVAAAGGISGS